jgi:hypothetical protein
MRSARIARRSIFPVRLVGADEIGLHLRRHGRGRRAPNCC